MTIIEWFFLEDETVKKGNTSLLIDSKIYHLALQQDQTIYSLNR